MNEIREDKEVKEPVKRHKEATSYKPQSSDGKA